VIDSLVDSLIDVLISPLIDDRPMDCNVTTYLENLENWQLLGKCQEPDEKAREKSYWRKTFILIFTFGAMLVFSSIVVA